MITITELGQQHGVTRVIVRAVLRKMDFIYVEGGGAHNCHRLSPWVLQRGYAKHILGKKGVRYSFDVLSPVGQDWINSRWSDTVHAMEAEPEQQVVTEARSALQSFKDGCGRHDIGVHGSVLWLRHHFPDVKQAEMANILSVTQQLVSRYLNLRDKQLTSLRARRDRPLKDAGKVSSKIDNLMQRCPPGINVHHLRPQHSRSRPDRVLHFSPRS